MLPSPSSFASSNLCLLHRHIHLPGFLEVYTTPNYYLPVQCDYVTPNYYLPIQCESLSFKV